MSSIFHTHTTRSTLRWLTMSLGTLSLLIVGYALTADAPRIQGKLLNDVTRAVVKWQTITAPEIMSGTTIPPNVNVIIHIPEEIDRITRRTLLGYRGETVRYWGYCFPHTEEEAYALSKRGFPGLIFLSEAEREFRRQEALQKRRDNFSIYSDLNDQTLNESTRNTTSTIRHQLEVFKGGTSCYIMTEDALPIGSDIDEDRLNAALEDSFGVDPLNPDTDGDGVLDGLEVFGLGTHPNRRDSDGDGLIDGIEDFNQNGRIDDGETNPTAWDSDRDELCDGICKINRGLDIRGEDKNLNGIYEPDKGEYDPRTEDSDGDGVLDEHEVYLCEIGGGDDC